jgi:hypothetical protein
VHIVALEGIEPAVVVLPERVGSVGARWRELERHRHLHREGAASIINSERDHEGRQKDAFSTWASAAVEREEGAPIPKQGAGTESIVPEACRAPPRRRGQA